MEQRRELLLYAIKDHTCSDMIPEWLPGLLPDVHSGAETTILPPLASALAPQRRRCLSCLLRRAWVLRPSGMQLPSRLGCGSDARQPHFKEAL
jgi:hypothetical protein